MNYYNEFDPFAAEWLRQLIAAKHIPFGCVDTRSIEDVKPSELAGYTQCHFFAGIGGWSYALKLAGWPEDWPVWTGSCPCQPFSPAGKGTGFTDERHLWPAFFHLISNRKPPIIFGEQVASKEGLAWIDLVQTDLENADYSPAAFDLCAASIGAPHIRQRMFWLAQSGSIGRQRREGPPEGCVSNGPDAGWDQSDNGLASVDQAGSRTVAHTQCSGGHNGRGKHYGSISQDGGEEASVRGNNREQVKKRSPVGRFWRGAEWLYCRDEKYRPIEREGIEGSTSLMEHAVNEGLEGFTGNGDNFNQPGWHYSRSDGSTPETNPIDWLPCSDGKSRPIEPSIFPLAHGVSKRVGRLRGYGNAIVPQVAAEVIRAYMGVM